MVKLTILVLALVAVSGPCLAASIQQPETHVGNISDVRYLLWTRSNPDDDGFYHVHHRVSSSLSESPFNADNPTYFIVHGFQATGLDSWILEAKTGILSQVDGNVFSVDWQKLCPLPLYFGAVDNVYKVGELNADFIDWLSEETGLAPEQVEMTGHSLGAHVCGITGKSLTTGTLGRITGMDPAGPLFHNTTSDRHILATDAIFVDIIHTNGGQTAQGEIGMDERLGDVDFYVNGGSHQAGCDPNGAGGNIIDLLTSCSHSRSYAYWRDSITETRPNHVFKSWPCNSWEEYEFEECEDCGQGCLDMGFHVNRELKGTYYLGTHMIRPFGKGDSQ